MLTWTRASALDCYGEWDDVPTDLRAVLDRFGSAIELENDDDCRFHPPGTMAVAKLSAVNACDVAGRELEAIGFVADAYSNQSVSTYFKLPGRRGVVRVSNHERGSTRPSGAEAVLAELVFTYRCSVDKDRGDIGLSEAEIREMVAVAAEQYRAAAGHME